MIATSRAAGGVALLAFALLCPGAALARGAPGAYTLVPGRSSLTYTFKQAGAENKGRFTAYAVSFAPAAGRLEVLIQTRSADTGDGQRDQLLRSRDFFDVARYPQARFDANRIVKTPNGYRARGSLTLRGVTHPCTVEFTWRSEQTRGRSIGELVGSTTVRRLDYGVGQGQWHYTTWIGNRVTVHFSLVLERR